MVHGFPRKLTVPVLALAALGLSAPAATATGPAPAAAWTATHDTGTASGTTTRTSEGILIRATVEGELSSSDGACYAAWIQVISDLAPGPLIKNATVCGTDTAAVGFQASGMPTTTYTLRVCRGTENATDCSVPVRL